MTLAARTIDSPFGDLTVVASPHGLRAVLWPDDREGRVVVGDVDEHAESTIVDDACAQLEEYFAGSRTTFELPLDLVGTDFQVDVWSALADIPYGETATYAEQASRIGRPKAVRAVGAANGRNPVSIVLPCHRVIGADGSLTGFAGGLDAKRQLLDHEAGTRSLF